MLSRYLQRLEPPVGEYVGGMVNFSGAFPFTFSDVTPGPARNERHLPLQIDSWTDAGQPLGSILLGQSRGIDRWSGLSELAGHQDHGVWRKYKQTRSFLHI